MSHQDRREPLPTSYQFGDAGKPTLKLVEVCLACGKCVETRDCGCPAGTGWRSMHENAAQQLVRKGQWNSIEPEEK